MRARERRFFDSQEPVVTSCFLLRVGNACTVKTGSQPLTRNVDPGPQAWTICEGKSKGSKAAASLQQVVAVPEARVHRHKFREKYTVERHRQPTSSCKRNE